MKKMIFKSFSFAVFLYSSFSLAGAVNDTNTKLVSYGNGNPADCSVIKPYYGYLTYYGRSGGSGKSIILGLAVTNLSYSKDIWIGVEGQGWKPGDFAGGHGSSYPVVTTLGYDSQTAYFEVVDSRIGPNNSVVLNVSVKMNGQTYNCGSIKIGQ